MADVVNILLPIFAIIALGAFLRRSGFASPQLFRETNRLVYYVALPPFLFLKSAESQLQGDATVRIFLTLVGGMASAILLGYIVARLLRLSPPSAAAFAQGSYRSNLAYVGLPLVLLAFASRGGEQASALQALGVISIALLTPIYNIVAVFILVGSRPGSREQLGPRLRELGYRLVTNPLILSCAAGLLVMGLGWKLPQPLRQTLETVGDMSTPLALLGIGGALRFGALRAYARNATAAALLKTIASPLAGLPFALWLGLSQPELRMALLLLACPTAPASYVMAQQMGADDGLAANIVAVATVLAAPALAVVIALT